MSNAPTGTDRAAGGAWPGADPSRQRDVNPPQGEQAAGRLVQLRVEVHDQLPQVRQAQQPQGTADRSASYRASLVNPPVLT